MISFEQALQIAKEKLAAANLSPAIEWVPLGGACGRVLAHDVAADRDYPPFHRSIRDGFAVRSSDVASPPIVLRQRGEVRAGGHFAGAVAAGEAVSIMTGAPLPNGADAVVMVEFTESHGDEVRIEKGVRSGENVVQQGSEAAKGVRVLPRHRRLGPGELGLLATMGKSTVPVFAKPRVAILPTGDEVVPVDQTPEWFQIRNSNAITLSALVDQAGGIPHRLGIAPDSLEPLRAMILEGLDADLLLLSGGISVGKYDFVERALADLGAELLSGGGPTAGKAFGFRRGQRQISFRIARKPGFHLRHFRIVRAPRDCCPGWGNSGARSLPARPIGGGLSAENWPDHIHAGANRMPGGRPRGEPGGMARLGRPGGRGRGQCLSGGAPPPNEFGGGRLG